MALWNGMMYVYIYIRYLYHYIMFIILQNGIYNHVLHHVSTHHQASQCVMIVPCKDETYEICGTTKEKTLMKIPMI